MSVDFEAASENLDALIQWAQDNDSDLGRNEATTRFALIDRLLIECLGWSPEEVIAEDHEDGKYADYVLGKPARKAVLEAKREGDYFELPAGLTRRILKARTLCEGNEGLRKALEQAIGYAQQRGIAIASVCNGHQLVALIASRQDGVAPLDGHCLVFPSLEELRNQFRWYWDNLSEPGMAVYNLHRTLHDPGASPPPDRLSNRIADFPGYRIRNTMQADLQILGELFLQDLAASEELEDEFLLETYCPSGALSQFALVSKEILRARYSALFDEEAGVTSLPATDKSGIREELRADIVASALSRRPIVLLGDVGVGKTMFIRRLIRVDARDVLEDRSIVLYVDFGTEAMVLRELGAHVHQALALQLRDKYGIDIEDRSFVQGVYHGELQRFDRSIYGELKDIDPAAYARGRVEFLADKLANSDAHMQACLEHIVSAQSRQVVIFLDNIDQHPLEFQEQVFLHSQAMADRWRATVFVSLRPKTFFHSQSKGTLSAYQPKVFTIAPPRVDLVIKRRVRFALNQLDRTGRLPWFPQGILVQTDVLKQYLSALLQSFERNEDLVEFIDNVSGGNVRRALDFVGTFVGSGHVDTAKILEAIEKSGSYTVTVHEFVRAVIFGDFKYFNPEASPVANMFEISSPDPREHFLLPILVAEARVAGEKSSDEGFVPIDSLYDCAQTMGFSSTQVKFALDRAFDRKLLEMTPRFSGRESVAACRITTAGAYTVERLVRFFTYVDAVVTDTPIVDVPYRDRILNVRSIADRVQRAEYFRNYLDKAWQAIADQESTFDWFSISSDLGDDIWAVGRRVDPDHWPS